MNAPISIPLPRTAVKTDRQSVKPRTLIAGGAVVFALALAAFYGIPHIRHVLSHEDTDDAQVEGDISPVLPRVSGYVNQVLVRDNQTVKAGDVLLEIDSRELDLKTGSAGAALENAAAAKQTALAALADAQAAEAVAKANVATAVVSADKTASDLARDTNLFQTEAITDRNLSDTRAAADLAKAQLESAKRQAEAATSKIEEAHAQVRAAEAQIGQRQSELDYAKLEGSYTKVIAPIDGIVSRKSIEPGQFVQAGQTLMSIASDSNVWVVANFKETQLSNMRVGQSVDFTADSYRKVVFHGKIESISGATGARFALLPPDNASGNFVKVTQRVPVKIVLDGGVDPEHPLRPGMSVDADVEISH